ncbi:cytochrome c3 family protein [Calderihabitans maritimus]|uniref:Cytochrome c7-like domain-containing protein n=1 Tax=Calderihabitans maritimus TaxID=1246530 RepID=A0A1Z5HPI7_9FIRM|nr:cytochrome c3 family protein [Calderihabitans maritimus]GAW91446.1 hypothetical protein CHY_0354 [Calderihabitans maritimus]
MRLGKTVWVAVLVINVVFFALLFLPRAAAATQADSAKLINEKCLQCHGNRDFQITRNGEKINLYIDPEEYQNSMHGTNACTTCHSDNQEIPHTQVAYGRKLALKVVQNCEKCHVNVNSVYRTSAHGKLEEENAGAALCSDCHGSHNIYKKEDPRSSVHRQNVAHTCQQCHQGEVMESYEESFHGKAVSLGSKKAATCVDCHGSHNILGQENPESTVHKNNVPETCAQCHIKPRPNFAKGVEHWVFKPEGPGKPMYYTLKFFTWLTIITITLLIIHIELELFRKLKDLKQGHQGSH